MKSIEFVMCLAIIGFIILGVASIEVISGAAITALLTMIPLMLTWYRFVGEGVKRAITHPLIALPLDLATWYLGWHVLPDSGFAKVTFVMIHILFDIWMIFEYRRSRGLLGWQKWQEKRRRKSFQLTQRPGGSRTSF